MPATSTRSTSLRLIACVMGAALVGCAGVSETEYLAFTPLPPNARVINLVKLTWEVRDDVGDYCQKAQSKGSSLQTVQPIACAVWVKATNECKVVTGPNPNHVVLGHEVRHCFEGHFHP